MPLDLVATLSDLVAIPSVNPMGRSLSGDHLYEHRVTAYLEKLFDRLGVAWERQVVEPLRENIVARIDGSHPDGRGGPLVMLEAHQDTVPTDGMTIDPWKPTVRDGRLFGRGSCDIKGGMTAMLGAFARLAEERPARCPTVVMACTVNEEHGYSGATKVVESWSRGSAVLPRRPDVAIVAEPTNLAVVVAHKGAVRWRCNTLGRAAHSSQPEKGDNSLYKMAQVVLALRDYAEQAAPKVPAHPLCGRATLSVGTIRGGISVNTVPERTIIEIDRRLLPGEDPGAVYAEVIEFVTARTGLRSGIEHEPPFLVGLPLANEHNEKLAGRLQKAAAVRGPCSLVGVPYGTDAATYAAAGVPSVVFGPGSIDQAHTADEWVPLDEVTAASEAIYRFICDYE